MRWSCTELCVTSALVALASRRPWRRVGRGKSGKEGKEGKEWKGQGRTREEEEVGKEMTKEESG